MTAATVTLDELPDVLTVRETAAVIRVSERHLSEMCKRGEFPHRRLGRNIRIAKSEVQAWLTGTTS